MAEIVEFVGLPGAGKSTLCERIAEALRAAGHDVHELGRALHAAPRSKRLRHKALRSIGCLSHAPKDAIALIRHASHSRQASRRALLSNAVNLLLVRDSSRRSAELAGAVLLDQGVLQALWSLGLEASTPPRYCELYDLLAASCERRLFVFVEADPATRAARLAARADPSFRASRHAIRGDELLASLHELALRIARERPGATVVRVVHGECDDQNVARHALDAVSRYLSERAAMPKALGSAESVPTDDDYDAKSLYDASVAARYDRQYTSSLSLGNFRAKIVAFWEERAFGALLARVPGAQSVLDVACGTGRYLRLLRERGHRPTGLDASADMLSYAQRNVPDPEIPLVEGDATALPFPDQAFDGVSCVRLYQRVPPAVRVRMLREVRRVARDWAILYWGGTTPWLELRRAVKTRVLRVPTDARFRSTLSEIRSELADAGLQISEHRWVQPALTDGVLVLVRF